MTLKQHTKIFVSKTLLVSRPTRRESRNISLVRLTLCVRYIPMYHEKKQRGHEGVCSTMWITCWTYPLQTFFARVFTPDKPTIAYRKVTHG